MNIPENVLVDDEDRAKLEAMGKWYVNTLGYCVKNSSRKLGKQKKIYAHRVIMNAPENMQIDHINNNRLDNRKCNLRIVTMQQNMWNKPKTKGYFKSRKKWTARITANGEHIHLGTFNTEEEARNAYIKAKEIYHKI
jgi:hypothetical protein